MSSIRTLSDWSRLYNLAAQYKTTTLRQFFSSDPQRPKKYSESFLESGLVDFSKQRINDDILTVLCQLADDAHIHAQWIRCLQGETINTSEQRPALHAACRAPHDEHPYIPSSYIKQAHTGLAHAQQLAQAIRQGTRHSASRSPFRHIVNIGIGGSDTGPRLLIQAFRHLIPTHLTVHFVSNLDPTELLSTLRTLDLSQTLFVVASKSFSTQETLSNATLAKQQLLAHLPHPADWSQHFIAITANIVAAQSFGIHDKDILPLWDWIGGRYSIWSPIHLTALIALGHEVIGEVLQGGADMDQHFLEAPTRHNIPILLALMGIWNLNGLGLQSQLILPYASQLESLPVYIQQLDMESNGKSVDHNGHPIAHQTSPVVWGSTGTCGQHTYHQLLHQGTQTVPTDFILVREGQHPDQANQHRLVALNGIAQSTTLAFGRNLSESYDDLLRRGLDASTVQHCAPHCVYPGNRPSTTLIIDQLTPRNLGRLLAMYEHKTFTQAMLWNINPYDQWGVELGKSIAHDLAHQDRQEHSTVYADDNSTDMLLAYFENK